MSEERQSITDQLREMNSRLAKQSPVPYVGKGLGQHYGSPLNSVHGPAPDKAAAVNYECADCQDLYLRLQKVFKDMGHEF